MRFSLKIAIRFLKSNKLQTLLIALGIAIGVSVQIFIGTLIQGLQKNLINKTVGNAPQITISSNTDVKTISNWESKYNTIKNNNKIVASTPSLTQPGFIKINNRIESILVRGLKFDDAEKIYNLKKNLYDGTIPNRKNEILIGKALRKELNLNKGDIIDIITPNGTKDRYTITGFYDLGTSAINKSWILTNIETAQVNFNLGNTINSVEVKLDEKDIFNANKIASEISKSLNDTKLNVDSWETQNSELLSALNGQSISSNMIQFFVLLSVILGIASVLAISVVQRSKQIGILKAMGVKDITSSQIFLLQGLILGFIGGFIGILLGLGLLYSFNSFALNADGSPIVPIYINYSFITISFIIAVLSATIAAVIPAKKSSKLQPMEVIRNG
ncbi:ABC transporter permease [Inconstantimicrobium mannanitabidum]|uniref:Permease n=1 Tax=Inconstantimicrobium mannanitabidum TaxID=1604901 RepID=A0ACB5RGR4_9CLOT|nr:FtsX-like permease family protein [Clostridium sp. TW13]GKX68269.1 permease [Clostridium sp. TW13]